MSNMNPAYALALVVAAATTPVAADETVATYKGAAAVASVNEMLKGQTFGHWAADWWQWAISIPADVNPMLDATGANCGQWQYGPVWFLAGYSGGGQAERSCAIPYGKSLFFPTINNYYGAFLNDPAEVRTEAYARKAAACTLPVKISVWIDGEKVAHPENYFTGPGGSQSPFFNVVAPPTNVFGMQSTQKNKPGYAVEMALSPSTEQGYYLFLRPLSRGTHTIVWYAEGCTPTDAAGTPNKQDIRYTLTVN